ncbi:MAG: hypothetical protein IPG80_19335 [Anaerolineales bacterium]|jgi:hypothetical protein|uniref:hypothetical protein n=1 Tax=Candidatus Villigracilis vicinus TaxID=3140679 RepID=UPI0031367A4B|nr:hypothetical protein [Anaerolineales bacterium]MBK7447864.1 hypothetical protein [Anaerolineales bacterium]MBK9779237.1 hypothetical protein [Anaerolineales bacterium]
MNASKTYLQFFRVPSINDKLSLLRNLLEARELNEDIALAMLKSVHKELGAEQTRDRTEYKRYAEMIEVLRYHQTDLLEYIVDAWNVGKSTADPEWISDGLIK